MLNLIDKNLLIAACEKSLDYVRLRADITSLADIETALGDLRTAFDVNPDAVTAEQIEAVLVLMENAKFPSLKYIEWAFPFWFPPSSPRESLLTWLSAHLLWELISGKPAAFPPEAHEHAQYLESVAWADVTGKPAAYPPDTHTHAQYLESVAWADVTSKPATYPPETHDHPDYDDRLATLETDLCQVKLEYVDASNVKVLAGTRWVDDVGSVHVLSADVTLNTTTDLAAAETLTANTWLYIWAGIDNNTTQKLVLSASDTMPADLWHGRNLQFGVSIYNVSGLKIRAFDHVKNHYRYREEILIFSGDAPTSSTQLTLSAYCPASVVSARVMIYAGILPKTGLSALYLSLDNNQFVTWALSETFNMSATYYKTVRDIPTTIIRRVIYFYATDAFTYFSLSLQHFECHYVN